MSLKKLDPVYLDWGEHLSISLTNQGRYYGTEAPDWINVSKSGTTIALTGSPPRGGFFLARVSSLDGGLGTLQEIPIFVSTPPAPDPTGYWQVLIFRSDGSGAYVDISDRAINPCDLVTPPNITMETNAPSSISVSLDRVRVDPMVGVKWSDGQILPIKEGMQIVISLYDHVSKMHMRMFNDIIIQIDRSKTQAKLMAYDALMRLAHYKEPVKISTSVQKRIRNVRQEDIRDGKNYTMPVAINEIVNAWLIDKKVEIPPGFPGRSVGGTEAGHGDVYLADLIGRIYTTGRIKHIQLALSPGTYDGTPAPWTVSIRNASGTTVGSEIFTRSGTVDYTTGIRYVDIDVEIPPGTYFIGCKTYQHLSVVGSGIFMLSGYRYMDGNIDDYDLMLRRGVWQKQNGKSPIRMISFTQENERMITDKSELTINKDVIFTPSNILNNGGEYGLIVDASTGLVPIITGAVSLIERTGISCDASLVDSQYGVVWYLTSTYDYLSVIQEMVGSDYCIQADPSYPGQLMIKPAGTIKDDVSATLVMSPDKNGEYCISASKTKRAVPSRITRPTIQTESNDPNIPPMSIQTDDCLYEDSVERRIGWPMIEIYTDKSLRDRTAVANIANNYIAKLHRSDLDGTIELTENLLPIWSSSRDVTAGGRHLVLIDDEGSHNVIANLVTISGRKMSISLDSIRPDNAIPLGGAVIRADNAQGSTDMPDTVYIYVRKETTVATRGNIEVIRSIYDPLVMEYYNEVDEGGYHHSIGYIGPSQTGYATDDALIGVRIGEVVFPIPETHAWPNQSIYVDVRTLKES